MGDGDPHLSDAQVAPPLVRRSIRCPRCGYDLLGLTKPRCPECGMGFPRRIDWTAHELWKAAWLAAVVTLILLTCMCLVIPEVLDHRDYLARIEVLRAMCLPGAAAAWVLLLIGLNRWRQDFLMASRRKQWVVALVLWILGIAIVVWGARTFSHVHGLIPSRSLWDW